MSPLPTSYIEIWEGFARIRELIKTRKYEDVVESDSRVT